MMLFGTRFSLVRFNPFFVLDFLFNIVYRVRWFYFERNSFPCERLDEDLHIGTNTQYKNIPV